MSRLFQCGFENGQTMQSVAGPYWEGNYNCNSSNPARTGNRAMFCQAGTVFLNLAANYQELWIGVGFRPSDTDCRIYFRDNTTDQLTLTVALNGQIDIRRGDKNAASIANSAPGAIIFGQYNYLVIRVRIADSGGAVEVYLNGSTTAALSFSGDTQNGSNAHFSRIGFEAQTFSTVLYLDDIYINTTAGSVSNGNDKDLRIYPFNPNGDGSHTAWAASAGNRWDCVNDGPSPNDDTDYITGTNAGDKYTATLENLPFANGVITGVQGFVRLKKTDAGSAEARLVSDSGGTINNDPAINPTQSYAWYQGNIQTVDPATSVAWTVAGVNGLHGGVERTV